MTLGIVVMIAIIVVDLVTMYFVLRVGSKHDKHNEVDTATNSEALQTLQAKGVKLLDSTQTVEQA